MFFAQHEMGLANQKTIPMPLVSSVDIPSIWNDCEDRLDAAILAVLQAENRDRKRIATRLFFSLCEEFLASSQVDYSVQVFRNIAELFWSKDPFPGIKSWIINQAAKATTPDEREVLSIAIFEPIAEPPHDLKDVAWMLTLLPVEKTAWAVIDQVNVEGFPGPLRSAIVDLLPSDDGL